MTVTRTADEKLADLAERAGLRVRTDRAGRSVLVRMQDDVQWVGYVAQYVDGKARTAYWWPLRGPGARVPVARLSWNELKRRIRARDGWEP